MYFEQKPTVHTLQIVGWDDLSHLSDIVFERQWLSIRINANVWLLVFGFSFLIKRYMKVEAGCNRNFTVLFKQPSACRLTFNQRQHFLGFIGARRCLGI